MRLLFSRFKIKPLLDVFLPFNSIGAIVKICKTISRGIKIIPGDGSAREYAASCQKVLGGLANICIEYATKRYRSNCVNWGILPFTNPDKEIVLEPGEYVYLPGIRKAVEEGATKVTATVIGTDGSTRPMELELKNVTEAEKKVLLAGSLINFYKEEK